MDRNSALEVICRQTNYDLETADTKLTEWGTIDSVVSDYLSSGRLRSSRDTTVAKPRLQQEMFTQMRKQMDASMRRHNALQERKLIDNLASMTPPSATATPTASASATAASSPSS